MERQIQLAEEIGYIMNNVEYLEKSGKIQNASAVLDNLSEGVYKVQDNCKHEWNIVDQNSYKICDHCGKRSALEDNDII